MNVEELSESLKQIQKQLDEVLVIVKELLGKKKERAAAKKAAKAKPSPLTEEEITKYKDPIIINKVVIYGLCKIKCITRVS